MQKYFIKTPWWLKKLYPKRIWDFGIREKIIYLTFDDGPHPEITPFILDELKKHNAVATFFCIGKNVQANPEIYQRILMEGHCTGNHTYHHLNGWNTKDDIYIKDTEQAAALIQSDLFRPPYGRLTSSQAKKLKHYRIVMWDVLSGDFDNSVSKEKCLKNVLEKAVPGSIIVFHDSEKAREKVMYALPRVLNFFGGSGYKFLAIT